MSLYEQLQDLVRAHTRRYGLAATVNVLQALEADARRDAEWCSEPSSRLAVEEAICASKDQRRWDDDPPKGAAE